MEWLITTLIALAAGSPAALIAYLASRRKTSGLIKTSEAQTLWDAQEKFREDQEVKIAKQDVKIAAQDLRIAELTEKLAVCERKHAENELGKVSILVATMQKDVEITALRSELDEVKAGLKKAAEAEGGVKDA